VQAHFQNRAIHYFNGNSTEAISSCATGEHRVLLLEEHGSADTALFLVPALDSHSQKLMNI